MVPNPRGELNPLIPVGEQIATRARVHLKLDKRAARAKALDMLRKVRFQTPSDA
ncbi:hypothetical protein ACTMU2_20020 [Cupriavidus basilensis]